MIFLLALLALADGMFYRVTLNAHSENVAVVAITECKGKQAYFAFDRQPIVAADSTEVRVRRQPTPAGARCTVQFDVVRSTDEDPEHEYIGESIVIIQVN